MTVATENSRSTYTGNGVATSFNTGFYFLQASHLHVTLELVGVAPTVLTNGVHFSTTMPASVGANGSITMFTPPPSGAKLVIERDVPFTQLTSYRIQGTFNRGTHEDGYDLDVMMAQQLDRRITDLESISAPSAGVAGDGLYVNAGTWNVGPGNGVKVNANDVEVIYGDDPGEMSQAYHTGSGNFAGGLNKAAHVDHVHDVPIGSPAALAVGDAGDPGGLTTALAAADHRHQVPIGTPVAVSKSANAQGSSQLFAAADHKHDVATAAAVELTDSTNAEGNATTLARSNHTHSHGVRGGGTLHALATTSTPGFMSAADKLKLDGLLATTELTAEVDTFTLTPTTLINFKPVNDGATYIDVRVVAFRMDNGSQAAGYGIRATVKNWAGGVVLVGQARLHTDQESTAAWDVTLSVSSPGVIIAVTGANDVPIKWVAEVRLTTAYI
ncbi:MAG: hypothetical protein DI536_04275 [Archangium gephyra]|uniref:Uncharacterized protein n=1 Tax=Archangium gephyra TaxID=48 RepID=A0A2W5TZ16_9BACT|nr:MAG: hypothetical protein DI536_04275 [Archangium gephyra]